MRPRRPHSSEAQAEDRAEVRVAPPSVRQATIFQWPAGRGTLDVLFGSNVQRASGTLARGDGAIDCMVDVDVERL